MPKVYPTPTDITFALRFVCDADWRAKHDVRDLWNVLDLMPISVQMALDFPRHE